MGSVLTAWLLCVFLSTGFHLAGQTPARPVSEYELKAVFLAKLPLFVKWPPGDSAMTNSPFLIGVLGDNPFGGLLETTLAGKSVEGRPVKLVACREAKEAAKCQLVFVAGLDPKAAGELCRQLAKSPVLTVSDVPGFVGQGGMVGLVVADRKVRLEIDAEAAQQAGLRIDPQLLRMAKAIKGSSSGPPPP